MAKREEGQSMDCSEVAELLPVYLNQSLEASMARRLEVHLATCAACRQEECDTRTVWALHEGHLPVELLLDYALAQPMSRQGLAVVESHLAACERCSKEVTTVRLEGVGQRAPGAVSSVGKGLRVLAWAACLAAIVASAGWIQTWRQLVDERAFTAARVHLAVVELLPATQPLLRRGSTDLGTANLVELPDNANELVLVLLFGDRWCESGCQLEIHESGQGPPKRRVEGLTPGPDGHLTLALPSDWLPPERSVLAVRDQTSGELVAEYLVELQPSATGVR